MTRPQSRRRQQIHGKEAPVNKVSTCFLRPMFIRNQERRVPLYTKALGNEWNVKVVTGDKGQRHNIPTPDGRFNLVIAQEASELSITSCVYRCRSEIQSMSVMKKALELNFLTRNRHGFALAIDPSHNPKIQLSNSFPFSAKNTWNSAATVALTLCCSKPLKRMGFKQFRKCVKDFCEVAHNVQSQLESIDEGRLGVLPLSTAYTYDEELGKEAATPKTPIMLAHAPRRKLSFDGARTSVLYDDESVASTDSIKPPPTRCNSLVSLPAFSLSSNTPNQPSRSTSIGTGIACKSFTKKKLIHFKNAGDARLFETFMRKKKEFVQKTKEEAQKQKEFEAKMKEEDDQAMQRALCIGMAAKQSLVARECDHTPLISNRKNTEDGELDKLDFVEE